MNIETRALGAGIPTAASSAHTSCPADTMLMGKMLNETMLLHAAAAGVDSNRLKTMLGPERVAKMESAIKDLDTLNEMGQQTVKVMLNAHNVPASSNWRDVLGDIKALDQQGQSRALATLASRIQHLPSVAEKTALMDAIGEQMDELRGHYATDAMYGFAAGIGAACRADPDFERFNESRD